MVKGLVGVIGGTVLAGSKLFLDATENDVDTPYGRAKVYSSNKFVFIQRHCLNGKIPPHMINHRANLWAMKNADVSGIMGVGSVGSLRKSIKPSYLVVPDDFIQLSDLHTFFDYEIVHATPVLDAGLRSKLVSSARKLKVKCRGGGVYAQTRGPRLETKAEVRMLQKLADVVGMTLASEATLACELKIPYAMLCSVDNYANGLARRELDFKEVVENSKKNTVRIEKILKKLLR
ncbi:MAG: MTAP family purine nucleoside phosphorylase [Candidatus Altiarchaeota archaeon]|nr:MTAP family purine nucleoside phosphorylase [Candidatus Altiarchaeota archaeon]